MGKWILIYAAIQKAVSFITMPCFQIAFLPGKYLTGSQYSERTILSLWLLMPRLLMLPVGQGSWCWICRTNGPLSPMSKDFELPALYKHGQVMKNAYTYSIFLQAKLESVTHKHVTLEQNVRFSRPAQKGPYLDLHSFSNAICLQKSFIYWFAIQGGLLLMVQEGITYYFR